MGLLELDAEEFRASYNRRPFLVRHRLAGHPLFERPRLIALAKSLEPQQLQYHVSDVPVGTDFESAASKYPNGMSIEATIENIEAKGSYVLMKNVETSPDYGKLLDDLLDEVDVLSNPIDPGMCERVAFLMISSPHAVTPYHMDRELNFLLQVEGQKNVNLWDPTDRSVVSEHELEWFFAWHSLKETKYREANQQKAHVYELNPGQGVHHPSTAPHWVKNGDRVSVSFSITFRTAASNRRDRVYRANHALRRMGLTPRPFGASPPVDSVKAAAYRVYSAARGWVRKSDAQA
jgi:hypothetical protein